MNHTSLRFPGVVCAALVTVCSFETTHAQPVTPQELLALQQTLAPVAGAATPALTAVHSPIEPPRISMTARGYLRSIGAPPGYHFVPTNGLVTGSPATVARSYLLERGRWFGIQSPRVDFTTRRERQSNGRHYLRLQQHYQGLPVVAAEVVVQVDAQGGIECVLSDIETATTSLDSGAIALTPTVSAEAAAEVVRNSFAGQAAGLPVQNTSPVLSLFAPSVLDETGPQQLVWDMVVFTEDRNVVNERVLLDAISGNTVRVWTQRHTALSRQISDKNNSTNAASVVRTEGQPPCGIADADNAYAFLGDTYNYYLNVHGRDSYNGAGATLTAITRYCETNTTCPWTNATAGTPMRFGNGFATDDVVAHEFTHIVTAAESGLIYTNESGAINESLSDIWGEFVDLGNGAGNDAANVRWQIGEDLFTGPLRSMRFPTNFNDPDRLGSPFYQQPANTSDLGGVHRNSGVNNKLCYLLTDGDTFNGQTVYGMGITPVARLYYEAQVSLLTAGSGWQSLFDSLQQAAVNLGWSIADRNNLYRACDAVEINSAVRLLFTDWTSPCPVPTGLQTCVFPNGPYHFVFEGVNGARPGDILRIRGGTYGENLTIEKIMTLEAYNGEVTIGQ